MRYIGNNPTVVSVNAENYISNSSADLDTTGWQLYSRTVATISSVDVSANVLNVSNNTIPSGVLVQYINGGTAIGGLSLNGRYYTKNATSSGFSLSLSRGGDSIDLTSAGTGPHSFRNVDPIGIGGNLGQRFFWRRSADKTFSMFSDSFFDGCGVSIEFSDPGIIQATSIQFRYRVIGSSFQARDLRLRIVALDQSKNILDVIEPNNAIIQEVSIWSKHSSSFQTIPGASFYRLCIDGTSENSHGEEIELEFDSFFVGEGPEVQVAAGDGRVVAATLVREGTSPNQDVTTTAETKVQLRSATVDTVGGFDSVNFRYLIKVPGLYSVSACASVTAITASEAVTARVKINGSSVAGAVALASSSGIAIPEISAKVVYCAAGDYVELYVQSTADTNYSLGNSPTTNYLSIQLISASPATITADSSRVIAAKMYRSAALTIAPNNSYIKIPVDAVEFDTTGAASTAQGRYVVQEPGFLDVEGFVSINSTNVVAGAYFAALYKNGVLFKNGSSNYQSTATQSIRSAVSAKVYCNAGDYLELYFFAQPNHSTSVLTVGTGAAGGASLEINKIPAGSFAAAPSETVAMRYSTSAGQSIPNSTGTIVKFGTKAYDSHNFYNPSTGIATAPMPGLYQVNTMVEYALNSTGFRGVDLSGSLISGSHYTGLGGLPGSSVSGRVWGSSTVRLLAGETIQINAFQSSGSSLALSADGQFNWVSITRIGNYV